MTHRQIGFALLCILIALVWGGWKRLTWAMTQAQKRGWFLFACAFFLFVTYWLAKPVIKYLF